MKQEKNSGTVNRVYVSTSQNVGTLNTVWTTLLIKLEILWEEKNNVKVRVCQVC